MRILLLTDGVFPFVIGGMQKHSYYLAKYLTLNKVHVHLVHTLYNNDPVDELRTKEYDGFDLDYITFEQFQFPNGDRFPGHYVRRNKRLSDQIYESLKDRLGDFDFIYAKGFVGNRFIEERLKGNLKVPVSVKLHGYEMYQKAPSTKVKLEHLLLRSIARFVTVNADYVWSYGGKITGLIQDLGVPKERILIAPSGIESQWVRQGDLGRNGDKLRFVFLGRFERRKGVEELTSILNQLTNEGINNFEFHFIGPVPDNKRIVADHIIYHGQISDQEKIKDILYGSDVLVCPSYSEGMPNVIMEGMASGLAIIATNVGAVADQVDQANGILIEQADPELIKGAILQCLSFTPEELAAKRKGSIAKINDRFLWSEVVLKKAALIQNAIS